MTGTRRTSLAHHDRSITRNWQTATSHTVWRTAVTIKRTKIIKRRLQLGLTEEAPRATFPQQRKFITEMCNTRERETEIRFLTLSRG